MANNVAAYSQLKNGESGSIGTWMSRIEEGISQAVRLLIRRKRPRVSLFTGSAFVLLSLVLPFTYDSCGSVKTGYEFLNGEGVWPGLAVLASDWASRGFYVLTLSFAVLTAALVVFSCVRPESLQGSRLTGWGYGVAGTLSLFVISNLAWSMVFSWMFEESPARALYAVSILYWLAPTVLWYRHDLSSKRSMTARWNGTRSGIFLLYLPAAVIDFYLMLLISLGGLWGFVTFFIGIHLLALGYMELGRRAAAQSAGAVSAPETVIANSELDTVPAL